MNGINGRIEEYDSCIPCAMSREFQKETGLIVEQADCNVFSVLYYPNCEVYVYVATSEKYANAKTTTDEMIKIVDCENVDFSKTVSNLNWLIPMAIVAGTNNMISRVYF